MRPQWYYNYTGLKLFGLKFGGLGKDHGLSFIGAFCPDCTEYPIYVFPEKELRGLSPNSYIHMSVND